MPAPGPINQPPVGEENCSFHPLSPKPPPQWRPWWGHVCRRVQAGVRTPELMASDAPHLGHEPIPFPTLSLSFTKINRKDTRKSGTQQYFCHQ